MADRFKAHGALPVELAHLIYETIAQVQTAALRAPNLRKLHEHGAEEASQKIQTAVAEHLSTQSWAWVKRIQKVAGK